MCGGVGGFTFKRTARAGIKVRNRTVCVCRIGRRGESAASAASSISLFSSLSATRHQLNHRRRLSFSISPYLSQSAGSQIPRFSSSVSVVVSVLTLSVHVLAILQIASAPTVLHTFPFPFPFAASLTASLRNCIRRLATITITAILLATVLL